MDCQCEFTSTTGNETGKPIEKYIEINRKIKKFNFSDPGPTNNIKSNFNDGGPVL